MEETIESLAKKYGCKCKFIGDIIYVKSKINEWYIQSDGNEGYKLLHKNSRSKYHFHMQENRHKEKIVKDDLEGIFRYIKNHDNISNKMVLPVSMEYKFKIIESKL